MGTRSLTIVRSGVEKTSPRIITMYRQMDGYPTGHGLDLAEFLSPIKMVNGISLAERQVIANGVGCLAAQIVAHFKKEAGGIYLQTGADTDKPGDSGEEYIYEIYANTFDPAFGIIMSCFDVYEEKEVFKGTPQEFISQYSEQNTEA